MTDLVRVCFSGSRRARPTEELFEEIVCWAHSLAGSDERGMTFPVGVGDAPGLDAIVNAHWLSRVVRGWATPRVFAADWDTYGRAAGPRRNRAMAKWAAEADEAYLIAFPDDESRGTWDCIRAFSDVGATVIVSPVLRGRR